MKTLPLDVQDRAAVEALLAGVDTVIHLAWYMQSDKFYDVIVPVNVVGTYNIYEAARLQGVRRVIFGSSNHVTGFYKIDETVTPDMPMRPDSLYGLAKSWGEMVGRLYADKYGVSSINLRIGNFHESNQPQNLRATRIWISHRDVVQLMIRCIEADPSIEYLTLYATSDNRRKYWDIVYLADLIGFQPVDDGEIYVKALRDAGATDDSTNLQGGGMALRLDQSD
jgi:uronate dehydrogenase